MRRLPFFVPGVIAAALLVSVGTVSAQVDPVAVHQRYVDSLNHGDLAAVVDLFADDGTFEGGGGCARACVGRDAIRRAFESILAAHTQLAITGRQVSGNTVIWRAEVRNDSTQRAGIERIITTGTTEVRGDKIIAHRSASDTSDPLTARYVAFLQTPPVAPAPAQVPRALPRTGDATSRDWAGLVLVGSLLLIAGIGLKRARSLGGGAPFCSSPLCWGIDVQLGQAHTPTSPGKDVSCTGPRRPIGSA